jgi:aminoglycoside phosphotransferase family enzyme/predicted kinase
MSSHLDRLIQAMSDPRMYPHRPDQVQVIQTHISVVFVAGDLVYKIKKPLNFGFLDFTTLEKRQHFCQREVLLNSRFSEGVYLGVVSICEGPGGLNLEGRGREVEAAVLMKRLPENRIMIRLLEEGAVTPSLLDRLADRLAELHALAPTGPEIASHGSFEVIRQNLKENFDQTTPYVGRTIDGETHEAVFTLSMEFLAAHRNLFYERMTKGFIRDCHGDLHLDHVVILNGIILYDCIEFNDRFRYGDTAADLGFLLMDLDFQGYPAFADRVSRRYAEASGDRDVLRLLVLYKSYRAFVRGKVMGFTLDEPEISQSEKESAVKVAGHYFDLSLSYLKPPPPPALIVTCGMVGTGKSFLGERLAVRVGTEPIRSDVLRKRMHGLSPSEHRLDKYGEGIYTSNATDRTYEELLDKARQSLDNGQSVVLDASFSRRRYRDLAHGLAREKKVQFLMLECTCLDEIIRRRLEERTEKRNEPSDATWEIFQEHKERFEPIQSDERAYCRQWDSTTDLNEFLMDVVRALMIPR